MDSSHILFTLQLYFFFILSGANYHGSQLWRVFPKTPEDVEQLKILGREFGLDFWKEPIKAGLPVDFLTKPGQANALRRELVTADLPQIEIAIRDVQALVDEEKRSRNEYEKRQKNAISSISEFEYSVYHTAEEIYEWMDLAAQEYSFIEMKQIGISYQGRPIHALEIKKEKTGTFKPAIYVDSLIHCREWISTASLMFLFKEMLQNSEFTYLVDEVDWYFVPMINVDGYLETWNGFRLWRKTRSTGPSSLCAGVDANRNFNDHWAGEGTSPHPCSDIYHGPTPASESEVRHLQNYIMGNKDKIDALITVHSYSQMILFPYSFADQLAPNNDDLNYTSKLMSDAMYQKHGIRYHYGASAATLYPAAGVTDDWAYNNAGIKLSYTFELRDEGEYGFLLPAEQIIPTGEEFLLGMEALANYLLQNPVRKDTNFK